MQRQLLVGPLQRRSGPVTPFGRSYRFAAILLFALVLVVGFHGPARLDAATMETTGTHSLLMGADSTFNLENMKTALDATLRLDQPIDILDLRDGLPSLSTLQQYDSVSVHSNFFFPDPNGLGDVLADYVDSGGGVVVMPFATRAAPSSLVLGGRWSAGGYSPLNGGLESTGTWTVSVVDLPDHPVLDGTEGIRYSGRFTPAGELNPNAVPIARWMRGDFSPESFLSAELPGFNGRIMLVNFYADPDSLNEQGFVLLANSLNYAAVPEPTTGMLAILGVALLAFRRRSRCGGVLAKN